MNMRAVDRVDQPLAVGEDERERNEGGCYDEEGVDLRVPKAVVYKNTWERPRANDTGPITHAPSETWFGSSHTTPGSDPVPHDKGCPVPHPYSITTPERAGTAGFLLPGGDTSFARVSGSGSGCTTAGSHWQPPAATVADAPPDAGTMCPVKFGGSHVSSKEALDGDSQVVFHAGCLTVEKCDEWRGEPGLGVKFLDNRIGSDLVEMQGDGRGVACVIVHAQGEDTRVLDILVRESARGKKCGKQVMLHTCRELFAIDGISTLQLNVVCRGKDRAALSKIINYCVAEIDGVVGGAVSGEDTWMMMMRE